MIEEDKLQSEGEGRIRLDYNKLKALRKKMCLSRAMLAQRRLNTGGYISESTIKRAEAGKKILYRTANEIASVLEVDVRELLID